MDKLTRYLILLFFFIVFLALAPVIVLYVSGTNLDDQGYNQTGVLDIQSEPSNAEIFLNDEAAGSTPAKIRFVNQGTYQIKISKPGYWDWNKDLYVKSNQVTYAGFNSDLILMLPKNDPQVISQELITHATLQENNLVYTDSQNTIKTFAVSRPEKIRTVLAAKQPIADLKPSHKPELIEIHYTDNTMDLLNVNDNKIEALPSQFKQADEIFITRDDAVFAKIGQDLWQSKPGSGVANKISSQVASIYVIENTLYYVQFNSPDLLVTAQWDGSKLINQQTLVSQQPWSENQKVTLYSTARRELFILADQNLYRVNQNLELVAEQVVWVDLNSVRGELTYRTPTGIWFYNFISSKTVQLYRSSEDLPKATVRTELGYGFIATPSGILAVETDTRNNQNTYLIYNSSPNIKTLITNNNEQILVLNQDTYQISQIKIK
ncbi:MAG: PEGA domain-containing protein [Candidatus Doudnabacteria bacterium]